MVHPQSFLEGYGEGGGCVGCYFVYKMLAGTIPFSSKHRNETVKDILEKELVFSS